MKYKVSFNGFAYVEADSPEEAEEKAMYEDDAIYEEKKCESIEEVDEFCGKVGGPTMERLTHEADFGLEDWEETLFFVKSDPNGAYNILDVAKYQGEPEFDEILKNVALRAEDFCIAYRDAINDMARRVVDDQMDDPEFVYAKAKIDEQIRAIVGPEKFAPWEERYGEK